MDTIYHSEDLGKPFLLKLKSELKNTFKGCKEIAIKIHFGEPGNDFAFKPEQIKPITNLLNELNIGFFFYDSSVAYGGIRGDSESYKKYAAEKGWEDIGKIRIDEGFVVVKGKKMSYEVCKPLTEAEGVLVQLLLYIFYEPFLHV
ncbi:MAG: hypothetical protein PHH54_02415 [Candidatus Nanoarchaeia archaeon]|nr:hypothetical protein [Candidatus Nanoarchaeia archaeon]MDD5740815.1 hypothetical protein [Candidatus Nanoarchaeia archaeon]